MSNAWEQGIESQLKELKEEIKIFKGAVINYNHDYDRIRKVREVLRDLLWGLDDYFELVNRKKFQKIIRKLHKKLDVGSARQTECNHEWVNTVGNQIRCDKCDQLKTEKKELKLHSLWNIEEKAKALRERVRDATRKDSEGEKDKEGQASSALVDSPESTNSKPLAPSEDE